MTKTSLISELERLTNDGYTDAEARTVLAATALLNRCFSPLAEPEATAEGAVDLVVMGGFAAAQRSVLAPPPSDLDLIASVPKGRQLKFLQAKASQDLGDGLRISVTPLPAFHDLHQGIYPRRFVSGYHVETIGPGLSTKLRVDVRDRPGGAAAEVLPAGSRLVAGGLAGDTDWRLCTPESHVADLVAASIDRNPPSQRYDDAYRLMLLSNLPLDGEAFAAALAGEFHSRGIPRVDRKFFTLPADPRFKDAYRRQVHRAGVRLNRPELLDDLPTYPEALYRIGRLVNPALRGEPLGRWEPWEVGTPGPQGHWSNNPTSRASRDEIPEFSPALPHGGHEPHLDQVAQLAQVIEKARGGEPRTTVRRTATKR